MRYYKVYIRDENEVFGFRSIVGADFLMPGETGILTVAPGTPEPASYALEMARECWPDLADRLFVRPM